MSKTWFTADLHLGHENSWAKFKKQDGSPLRPFKSTEEMNEMIIHNWNCTVGAEDRVYVLGDVVINRKFLPLISRLMGRKAVILGNHDIFSKHGKSEYLEAGFDKILSSTKLDVYMFTHIPIHPTSVPRWCRANVHGHLHSNVINDPKYHCVSLEQTAFTPIEFEELKDRIEKNYKSVEQCGRVWNYAYTDQRAWSPAGTSSDDGNM